MLVRSPRMRGGRTKMRAPGTPSSSIFSCKLATQRSAGMSRRRLAGASWMPIEPRPPTDTVEPPQRKPPAVVKTCSTYGICATSASIRPVTSLVRSGEVPGGMRR